MVLRRLHAELSLSQRKWPDVYLCAGVCVEPAWVCVCGECVVERGRSERVMVIIFRVSSDSRVLVREPKCLPCSF